MYCTKCGCEVEAGAPFCPGCGTTAPEMRPAPFYTSSNPPPAGAFVYAGFWRRFAAYMLDSFFFTAAWMILLVPCLLVTGALNLEEAKKEDFWLQGTVFFVWAAFLLVVSVGSWLYATWPECSTWQATPGKKLLGLIVTDLNGRRIGFGRANLRFWSKIISGFMYIGFIMIGFTDRKQGLHDMIAGTLVVRK